MPVKRIGCVALTFALVALAQAQSQPQYGIKEDRPKTGSHIRQYAVKSTRIPVNQSYNELSPEDKAAVHDQYEEIAPGDEPPFPERGLRALLDPIRKAQAELLVEGDLFLIVTVGPDGKAQKVTAIGAPSPEMTRFAAQVLLLTAYKPAMCGNQRCTMDFPLRVQFQHK
jgi:hypothetical protein